MIARSCLFCLCTIHADLHLAGASKAQSWQITESKCYPCLGAWFVTKQTIKREKRKIFLSQSVKSYINHGSSTSSPATFELIAPVWTSQTLFYNRKGHNEILLEPCAFHHTFISTCNREAGHETTDYRDSLNVACTCTCDGNHYKDRPWSFESWSLLNGLVEDTWSLESDFICCILSHTPLFHWYTL